MTWRDTFWTAMDAVRSHRLRSSLTMLGILIGITAVVLTVGIGQGASATVRDQINELGTNLLVVSPGSSTRTMAVISGISQYQQPTGYSISMKAVTSSSSPNGCMKPVSDTSLPSSSLR